MRRFFLGFAVTLAVMGYAVQAAPAADAPARDNATVWPSGPRPGSAGKAFLNIEGRPNGAFASFGVVDFNSGDLEAGQVSGVSSLTVTMVQTFAAFTSRGRMKFFVTTDTATSIQPDDPPAVMFDLEDINGLGSQLSTRYELGPGLFIPVRTGYIDSFTFTIEPGSALEAYLVAQINSGGTIRIVVAPEFDDVDLELVAGTYAGYTHATFSGPILSAVTVPAEKTNRRLRPTKVAPGVFRPAGTARLVKVADTLANMAKPTSLPFGWEKG
jgi:hypothetical protein